MTKNKQLQRMKKAFKVVPVTCAHSQRAATVARGLIEEAFSPLITNNPDRVGYSIAAVVSSLWEAQQELKKLKVQLKKLRA